MARRTCWSIVMNGLNHVLNLGLEKQGDGPTGIASVLASCEADDILRPGSSEHFKRLFQGHRR